MDVEQHVLSDSETYNSIVVWALSGICSLVLGCQLMHRAFSSMNHVLSDNSSLLLTKGRDRLMLLTAGMLVADSVSNIYHFYMTWLTDEYQLVSHRTAQILSNSPSISLIVMIIFYRCAMVLVSDSAWRRYYLQFSRIFCLVMWLVHASGGYVAMHEAMALSAHEAIHAKRYTTWATALMVPVPLLSIVASIWSIRVASHRHNQTFRTRQVTPDSRTAAGMHKMASAGSRKPLPPNHRTGPPPNGPPEADGRLLAPPAPSGALAAEDDHGHGHRQDQFPLSRTFQWLNVVSAFLWVTVTLLAFFPRDQLIVDYYALLNLLLMLALANEYSFGHLIHFFSRRRKRSQRRTHAVSEEHGTARLAKQGSAVGRSTDRSSESSALAPGVTRAILMTRSLGGVGAGGSSSAPHPVVGPGDDFVDMRLPLPRRD